MTIIMTLSTSHILALYSSQLLSSPCDDSMLTNEKTWSSESFKSVAQSHKFLNSFEHIPKYHLAFSILATNVYC